MKNLKVLPLTLAVAASLASTSVLAEQTLEQRVQELEAKLVELDYVNDQTRAVLTPETKVPAGVVFSGYARYGMQYQGSDERLVNTYGALNGNATGRLGNEGNGVEFQLGRVFQSDSGAKWDVVVMLDDWNSGKVNVKKLYAGGTNLFESQPDLYIWAGRDFHQRVATDLNDYFFMFHDGQGAGFYNLNLGGLKLDLSAVAQIDGSNVADSGRYAITSKLHGISFGDSANLNLYANYGFKSDAATEAAGQADNAYQVVGEFSMAGQRLVARYSDNNATNSVFDQWEGDSAMFVSFDGSYKLSDKLGIQYVAAYQSMESENNSDLDRANYNVIVRPTYQWDQINSTWLETGYSVVDYDNFDATNSSWKVTLSQNIAIGAETWSRPMLRFYATVGNADNEYTGFDETTGEMISYNPDTVTVGAMFEAWW